MDSISTRNSDVITTQHNTVTQVELILNLESSIVTITNMNATI